MLTQQFIEVQSPLVCLSIFNISTPLKEYENIGTGKSIESLIYVGNIYYSLLLLVSIRQRHPT